jgi:hypothetical protein
MLAMLQAHGVSAAPDRYEKAGELGSQKAFERWAQLVALAR